MVKPVPPVPDYTPSRDADQVLKKVAELAAPDGATPDRHITGVRDLQAVWQDAYERWARAVARANAGGASHRQLSEAIGYSGRKGSQRAVYRGRELVEKDAATT